uniref:Uncharacterized protein n=1 Tax=Thermosporothrix sp. COM3 TaxID=2490863 RepID=A0A455SC89_9CHLR|nr:hypothetical protein KTC_01270 [Thermosporothrix sp. COM3]
MRRRLLYFYSLPLFLIMLLSLLVACINIFWKIPGSYNPASNQVLYTSPLDPAAIIAIVLMGELFLLCYLSKRLRWMYRSLHVYAWGIGLLLCYAQSGNRPHVF